MVVINISKEEFRPSWGANGHRRGPRERAASVARVVASYQFNRFSMNGRIGFLKVPVSPGEPHFLALYSLPAPCGTLRPSFSWTYGVFSVCTPLTEGRIFESRRALKLCAQLRVPASRKCIFVHCCVHSSKPPREAEERRERKE